jgi:hypothetical protein
VATRVTVSPSGGSATRVAFWRKRDSDLPLVLSSHLALAEA